MEYIVIAAVIACIVSIIVTVVIARVYYKRASESVLVTAQAKADNIIDDAIKTAETKKKEAILQAKEENLKSKHELEQEVKERRTELSKLEQRLQSKEEALDKKADNLEKREECYNEKEESIKLKIEEANQLYNKGLEELEKIAGLTSEQAKEYLLKSVEEDIRHEKAVLIKDLDMKARDEADKKAQEYIVTAIQRYAGDYVNEATIHVVELPNDDMKGRIIGREGRNIRAFESISGVDVIIDDTPEAVILSSYDPIRREIARLALEKLIIDGRIHPARIEEMIEKSRREVEKRIKEEGENAILEVGLHGVHPEIVKLLGRLYYRTSLGQNVLMHSIEVAHIAGLLAAETGQDVRMAKRAGLLHDIGKAVTHELEGSHVDLGVDICKKYKEPHTVINAVACHHGDCEPDSLVACLVIAADTISAARTGARRESIETYTTRLKQLEEIAESFEGVEKSFAIQAGREVRIMVVPEEINDDDMVLLAHDISSKVKSTLTYPGQIKINVIRESRVVDYAK